MNLINRLKGSSVMAGLLLMFLPSPMLTAQSDTSAAAKEPIELRLPGVAALCEGWLLAIRSNSWTTRQRSIAPTGGSEYLGAGEEKQGRAQCLNDFEGRDNSP